MYEYKDRIKDGYISFKLSKKQHNQLFQYRKIRWMDKFEYYYNDKWVILDRYYNIYYLFVICLLVPIAVVYQGYPETFDQLKRSFKQKKYGSFVSDSISKKSEKYTEVLKIINNK